jgi:hypothetical protein
LREDEPEKPLVSIIILVYNSLRFIEDCLRSVLRTDYENIEVIVVDNASRDGSPQYLQEKFGQEKKVTIVHNEVNAGFAEGNNIGARRANGKYLTFLNMDTTVTPNWIDEVLVVMEADDSVGACQGKLLLMEHPRFFDSAGDFVDKYGVMMRRGGDLAERDCGQYDKIEEIFSARGAAITIRRELFERIGGFDSSYFLTYEDIDLCWRVRLSLHKVVFVPKSVVYHYGGFSLTQERVFLSTRNWLTTLIKNYELGNLLRVTAPAVSIVVAATLAESLVKKKPALSLQRVAGLLWVVLNLKMIWAKRLEVQSQIRKISDFEVMSKMMNTNLTVLYWPRVWRRLLKAGVNF